VVLGDEDVLLENIDLHAQHPSADAASQEATTQALAKYPLHSSFAALRVLRQCSVGAVPNAVLCLDGCGQVQGLA
jgi:hypothetical protein